MQTEIKAPENLADCSIYELIAYHDYFRRHNGLITCAKIESEINSRSLMQRWEAKKFKYYIPIQSQQKEMYNNK